MMKSDIQGLAFQCCRRSGVDTSSGRMVSLMMLKPDKDTGYLGMDVCLV